MAIRTRLTLIIQPYVEGLSTLTKPRVVAVLVLTSMVGMLLARPVLPSVELFILANLGIGLARRPPLR